MSRTRSSIPESFRLLALLAVIVLGVLTTVGTGGGGGGGGGGGPSPLTYTGVTTQATVDQNNAQTLDATALQTGGAGTTVTAAVTSSGGATGPGEPRFIMLADTLKESLGRIDFASAGPSVTGAMRSGSKIISSPYGDGSLSMSLTYDDVTGAFSGTATYSNYCENADSCVSGDASFSGQLNTATLELISAQFTFIFLSGTENGATFQMSGSIGLYVQSATSIQVTMSFVIADSSGAYKIDNYVYLITDNTTYVEVSIPSGRFYHPLHGYVDVKTPTPLRYTVTNTVTGEVAEWPYQGSLEVDGANNTKALLTALSDSPMVSPQWQLQADTNGDGSWEMTITGDWVDL